VRAQTDRISLTPCKQIQLLSRIKTLNGQVVRRVSPKDVEKVCGEQHLSRSQVLGSE